jgi:aconitate hydratase
VSRPERQDPFGVRDILEAAGGRHIVFRLDRLGKALGVEPARLPYAIRILLESLLRQCDGHLVTEEDVRRLAAWDAVSPAPVEIPFRPARVILQDFTGVPCVADLAAMRDAVRRLGGDPACINPLVPVDLVIDHSVQVDAHGTADALARNVAIEFERNRERYAFLRWGQQAFRNLRVVPPATGIIHQVNLELLARVVVTRPGKDGVEAFPDTLVGTDSHTTMINGLGVLGWGVGGIEAEAVMLGQPISLPSPRVVGVRLSGALREGVTATDLALSVTQILRKRGVVDRFVEYFGDGARRLSLSDRAVVANMAPEYGATTGLFPVDDETIRFLRQTGRGDAADLAGPVLRALGLFREDGAPDPVYSDTVEIDLGSIEPSVAGPKRPQDRVPLKEMKASFRKALAAPVAERGYGLAAEEVARTVPFDAGAGGGASLLGHGAVVIASITSCTNTSSPAVMLAAGLLARNAVRAGLRSKPHVKTSLGPGSPVVTAYLRDAGLLESLEALGFAVVGYGCLTCIGNSGPLPEPVERAVKEGRLVAAAVLSGNRNFEGRVHPLTRANYLASPPLVVAFALAGTVDIDFDAEPLGTGAGGKPVFLRDLWPTAREIDEAVARALRPERFAAAYGSVFTGSAAWAAVPCPGGDLYRWDPASTYIQEPPFFRDLRPEPAPVGDICRARVLGLFGDSVTTDHISPAGDIDAESPAGRWLRERGVGKRDFNSYGARRGNDRVMVRGTFANIRLKNLLVPGVEGNATVHLPSGERMPFFDAAMRYREECVPLLIVAGKEYGTGSSRDWAAKGTFLLGVRAVLAESFERIHRSNLVGMGILPLQLPAGRGAAALGMTGRETFDIEGLDGVLRPRPVVRVTARRDDGTAVAFEAVARLDTPVDVEYYRNGGILPAVLRKLLKG